MNRYWAVAVLAAVTATATPTQCPQLSPRLPPGSIVIKTAFAETPYALADRFYGHGWMGYKIRDANPGRLHNGVFPANTDVVIPPDVYGNPVSVEDVARRAY